MKKGNNKLTESQRKDLREFLDAIRRMVNK
jgi:hypothetical protein